MKCYHLVIWTFFYCEWTYNVKVRLGSFSNFYVYQQKACHELVQQPCVVGTIRCF